MIAELFLIAHILNLLDSPPISGSGQVVSKGKSTCYNNIFVMSAPDKKSFTRLPTNVVPRNYALELKPDLEKFTFDGKLDITIEVSYQSSVKFFVNVGKFSDENCCFKFS